MVPTDLRYTKDHEWVRVEGDEATIGITQYAADQLGDIAQLLDRLFVNLRAAHACVPPTVIDAMRTVGVPSLTGTDWPLLSPTRLLKNMIGTVAVRAPVPACPPKSKMP